MKNYGITAKKRSEKLLFQFAKTKYFLEQYLAPNEAKRENSRYLYEKHMVSPQFLVKHDYSILK